jgi:hypothetical protein
MESQRFERGGPLKYDSLLTSSVDLARAAGAEESLYFTEPKLDLSAPSEPLVHGIQSDLFCGAREPSTH